MKLKPFSTSTTHDHFGDIVDRTVREIEALANDYVLSVSSEELERHFIDKASVMPLAMDVEGAHIEGTDAVDLDMTHDFRRIPFEGDRVIVRGTLARVAVPFTGARDLWKLRPSVFGLGGYPEMEVLESSVVLPFRFPDDEPDKDRLGGLLQSNLKNLKETVDRVNHDAEIHNRALPDKIARAVANKRERASNALGVLKALRLPIKPKDRPAEFAIPLTRKPSPLALPAASREVSQGEPFIDWEVYEHILRVMRSMSLAIERVPSAFVHLDEESLRSHFLVQLNGHYEGGATGETFNHQGKTDVLVRWEGRNAFIAECKYWKGPKGFDEAIDQLLGYLSWRDSKAAILIFNRKGDSTTVRETMHSVMTKRPERRRDVPDAGAGDHRYVLFKESDERREITITTMLFDLPSVAPKPKGRRKRTS